MRPILPMLLLLALASPAVASAHGPRITIETGDADDGPARWADRYDPEAARCAVTTEDGSTVLLLTRGILALQLSDRSLHRADRELRRKEDEESDGFLADIVRSAVIGSVRELLDHSLECPLDEVRDVEYRHGRLVVTSEDGERLFEGVRVNDRDVLENFSERDARTFVHEFRRLKDRGR